MRYAILHKNIKSGHCKSSSCFVRLKEVLYFAARPIPLNHSSSTKKKTLQSPLSFLSLCPDLSFLSFFPFPSFFPFFRFPFLHASLYLSLIGLCLFLRAWHMATRKRQIFGYVFPSDPHTGLSTILQSSHLGQGLGVVGAPQGPSYSNRSEPLSFLGNAHLAAARWQPFLYVFLSEPQTGRSLEGHFLGQGLNDVCLPHGPEKIKNSLKDARVRHTCKPVILKFAYSS